MILVTGATGNVGRQVVEQLGAAGVPVRALTRNVTATFPDGVEVVHGDLRDPLDVRGVDAVFLMWPLHTGDALPAVLETIGSRHVVFLGSGGVRDLPMAAQAELVSRRPRWTMIRPGTFAVNALWWAKQVQAGDEVRGAHGDLAMAMLHEADIAAVAVRSLLDVYAVMPRRPAVTTTVADVTGRPARTFAEWVADHAAEFGKMSA